MSVKFTPGPWQKQRTKIVSLNNWQVKPDPKNGINGIPTTVIDCMGAMGGDDTDADAKLIEAAPTMYNILKLVSDMLWQRCITYELTNEEHTIFYKIDEILKKIER